jgi:CSLREA domain-containing protein
MMTRTTMHPFKILAAVGAAFVMCGLLFAYASSPAWAATITVNSTADDADGADGECTLREAITAANTDTASGMATGECAAGSATENDIIQFALPGTAPWTVNLTGALPDLTTNIAIEGPGADQLTVRRDTGGDYTIFTVTGDTTVVTIKGMTISNGDLGGIENRATLTVTDSTISGNTLDSQGGGIGNYGDLTVTDSTISGNSSSAGGGILNAGTATVTGSTISGNSATSVSDDLGGGGGGIWSEGDGMTVTDSTISGNSADAFGGGIVNFTPLTVTDSTISGNTAGSADGSSGEGGGIWSEDDGMTVTDSTISGNTATGADAIGGGVYNSEGPTVIEFSTITKNTAPDGAGSGVASFGDTATTSTDVLSSIISANQGTDVDFVSGTTNTFLSRGYNLIGDGNATGAFNQTGDQVGVTDPGLDPLDSYGGPTQTHRLQSDSPALDAIPQGTNGCGTTFTEDQRGVSRPQGSNCDIGSFELEESDTEAPRVTSIFPRNGGEVGPADNVTATFSEDMQEASVINAFKLFRKGSTNQIAATVTYDAMTDIATLNPTNNLRRGVTYKAVVTTVAKDEAGNRLDQNDSRGGLQQKVWFFEIDN